MNLQARFYRDLGFSKISRNVPFASSKTIMDNYFNANSVYSEQVVFNKIGEPIKINRSIFEALTWSYGSIGDGNQRIYFFVDSIDVLTDESVSVNYTIDAYATKFFEVSLNEGHVIRRYNSGNRPRQPFSPIDMTATTYSLEAGGQAGGTIFFAFKQSMNPYSGIGYGCMYGDVEIVERNEWLNQSWKDYLHITDADVTGLWFCPLRIQPTPSTTWGWTQLPVSNINGWVTFSSGHIANGTKMPIRNFTFNTIYTDELHIGGIVDGKGNMVYSLPFGRSANTMKVQLRISLQSCQLECNLSNKEERTSHLEGMSFNLACEPIDFFIDSFSEYSARQRQYDLQNRDMQSKISMYQGIGGSLSGGATTGAIGAAGGGAAGGAIGAIAGVVTGIAGALVNRGIDNYYAPKITELNDNYYKLQIDTLSLSGTSISRFFDNPDESFNARVFQLSADTYSINRMNTDINTNGCYVDETNANVQSLVGANRPLKLGAISITGNLVSDWKQQIENRLFNGVFYKQVV